MTLYEINAELLALLEQVDEETGELTCDPEQLEALAIAREAKLEGLALYVKNLSAEAAAIKAEAKALTERQKAAEYKAARARQYLSDQLHGEKFKTPKVAVTWRKSVATELSEGVTWETFDERFLKYKDPEISLSAIREAIEAGETVPGAALVERQNIQIK